MDKTAPTTSGEGIKEKIVTAILKNGIASRSISTWMLNAAEFKGQMPTEE